MAPRHEHERLSSPQVFLWRMVIFLVIAGFGSARRLVYFP